MRSRNVGVTLMELMIVVAIVGILAAVAYPSYREQVLRGGRAEAKAMLMQQAQALEKCFTRFGVYDSPQCAAATAITNGPEGKYQVTVAAIDTVSFSLLATAQAGQTADTRCGNFTLDQAGGRGALDGTASTAIVRECW